MNLRWEQKDGQLIAYLDDEKAANENGDEPDIIGIVRDDGKFVATFPDHKETARSYERVPVDP